MTSCRKLAAIDYLGSILSLVGSALIILPLIWVGVSFGNANYLLNMP